MMNFSFFNRTLLFSLMTLSLFAGSIHAAPGAHIKERPTPQTVGKSRKSLQPKKRKENSKLTLSTMNLVELADAKERALKKNQLDVAIKYVEQMMKLANETDIFSSLLLDLADLYFKQGFYDKSARLYVEFCSNYPGKDQIEYAEYQAILSIFSCTLDAEHDQTRTEEAIARMHIFLAHETFNTYRTPVEKMLIQCYEKLIDADLNICAFLIKRKGDKIKNFKDVERRLAAARSDFLPYAPLKEPLILMCEIEVAQKKGESELVAQKELELASHMSKTPTLLAQTKTASFANRF